MFRNDTMIHNESGRLGIFEDTGIGLGTVEPDQIIGSPNDNEWETGSLGWWFGIAILMKGITSCAGCRVEI